MDCSTARLLWHFARPALSELEPVDARALEDHLRECGECSAWAQAEGALEDALSRAMTRVPVPAGLHDRILSRLAGVNRQRRHRRRTAGLAAAGLLVAALAGVWWWESQRSPVDFELFVPIANGSSPADVEAFFHDQGVTMFAPPQFRYELLEDYGLAQLGGRTVPRLMFVHRGTGGRRPVIAQVYFLSSSQFNLAEPLPDRLVTSGHTVLLPREGDDQYRFLIVFTGPSLDPFLRGDL